MHLVGDLHQPLHVGFLDGHGGTRTKVTFNGKEQTHELWDTGLLEAENESASAIGARLDQEFSAEEPKSWEAGAPKDWANETLGVTIKYVYPLPESHKIGDDYAKSAISILRKTIVQAGVRLAWLLNEALK